MGRHSGSKCFSQESSVLFDAHLGYWLSIREIGQTEIRAFAQSGNKRKRLHKNINIQTLVYYVIWASTL